MESTGGRKSWGSVSVARTERASRRVMWSLSFSLRLTGGFARPRVFGRRLILVLLHIGGHDVCTLRVWAESVVSFIVPASGVHLALRHDSFLVTISWREFFCPSRSEVVKGVSTKRYIPTCLSYMSHTIPVRWGLFFSPESCLRLRLPNPRPKPGLVCFHPLASFPPYFRVVGGNKEEEKGERKVDRSQDSFE